MRHGVTRVAFQPTSRFDDAAIFVAMNVLIYAQLGCKDILIILDRAPIHGKKMQAALKLLMDELVKAGELSGEVTVKFLNTPRYSPGFNPAEYVIHAVRQDSLYHLPYNFTVEDKAKRIQEHLARGSPYDSNQMANIWKHIQRLPKVDGYQV